MTLKSFLTKFFIAGKPVPALCMMILAMSVDLANAAGTVTLFVSPDGQGPACSRNAPCDLLTAKEKVKGLVAKDDQLNVSVVLQNGTYWINEPIIFDATDSGPSPDRPVRYRASIAASPGSDLPTFSGGVPVTGWTRYNSKLNIWQADLPSSIKGSDVTGVMPRNFIVNGQRAERASIPINPIIPQFPQLGIVKSFETDTDRGYEFSPEAIEKYKLKNMTKWKNVDDIEAVYTRRYEIVRCPVRAITSTKISIQERCWKTAKNNHGGNYQGKVTNGLNWLENNLAFLTKPGQWYLDKKARKIYYIPRPNEVMNSVSAILGSSEMLMSISNAQNIKFERLRFENTNWYGFSYTTDKVNYEFPGYAPHQSGRYACGRPCLLGSLFPTAAVKVSRSANITFDQNQFVNLGGTGLAVVSGSMSVKITQNQFSGIGGAALQIGTPSAASQPSPPIGSQVMDLKIENNVLADNAVEYWDNAALMIFAMQGSVTESGIKYATVSHNEIYNCPWSCISFGWYADEKKASNEYVLFEGNYIHDGMQRLHDGGGFYSHGPSRGIVLKGNWINKIGTIYQSNCGHPSWVALFGGIYNDAGSDDFTITNNLVTNIMPVDQYSNYNEECRGAWWMPQPKQKKNANHNRIDYDRVTIGSANAVYPGCQKRPTILNTRCVIGIFEATNNVDTNLYSPKFGMPRNGAPIPYGIKLKKTPISDSVVSR